MRQNPQGTPDLVTFTECDTSIYLSICLSTYLSVCLYTFIYLSNALHRPCCSIRQHLEQCQTQL